MSGTTQPEYHREEIRQCVGDQDHPGVAGQDTGKEEDIKEGDGQEESI